MKTCVEAVKTKWDQQHSQSTLAIPEAARVLKDYAHLLPARGYALDAACGIGGNALFLAKSGLDTVALDISPVAIEKLQAFSRRLNMSIQSEIQDLEAFVWGEKRFDVIVISRFLERSLADCVVNALKPGGVLFYQTFIREKVSDIGPKNPDYLLSENELLTLFQPLTVLAYREEGRVGDTTRGMRNEALLVGQRRLDSNPK